MLIRFKPNVTLAQDTVRGNLVSLKLHKITPAICQALESLLKGAEEEKITSLLKDQDELVYFYYYLELFNKHALLCYQTPLIEVVPMKGNFSLQPPLEGVYHLSRFALIRSENGELVMETPLSAVRVYLRQEALTLLHAYRSPLLLQSEKHQETLALLAAAKILVTGEETPFWEFHDLYFHTRSREGRHDSPIGGTFRFKGRYPSQPALKACAHPKIALSKPQIPLKQSLEDVLEKRHSIREQGSKPLSLQQLAEFLYRCARVKKVISVGEEEVTARSYAGGGARYELELYPVISQCEGLSSGVYHYHPLEHQLCHITELNKNVLRLLQDAQRASGKQELPQVLIVLGARFQRASWKYQSMAYALILKNAGVLIQTMYLVATAMGLAPCAIGAGNSDLFCEVMGTDYLEETSVAEFMLGSLK